MKKPTLPYIDIDYFLDFQATGSILKAWLELINQPFKDHPFLKDLEVPAPKELRDLSWSVHACHRSKIKIRLFQDGSYKVFLPKETKVAKRKK